MKLEDSVVMYLTGADWSALKSKGMPGRPLNGIKLCPSKLDLRLEKPNECEWSGVVELWVTSVDPESPAAAGKLLGGILIDHSKDKK